MLTSLRSLANRHKCFIHAGSHIPFWCSMLDSITAFATAFCVMLWRHHQTYVTNLIKALEKAPQLKEMDLNELQRAIGTDKVP